MESVEESEPVLTGTLGKLLAASISDYKLVGTMSKTAALMKSAYFNLEQVTSRFTAESKLSDFNDISRTLDSTFEPILSSVNETRNHISDAVINVQHSVKSLIYAQITNVSGDVFAKIIADVTAAVGQLLKYAQSILASIVLTIASTPRHLAESASALAVILNTTIDIVTQIISKSHEKLRNLPVKVRTIYNIASESLSLALTATDQIITEITSAIITESHAGLVKNVDNILSALVPVTSHFVGNVNIITIFVASFNINTLTLEPVKDVSPIVSEFSIRFKRLFGLMDSSLKALKMPVRALEVSIANLGAAILKVIQFISNLRSSEVAGSAVEKFSNGIKVRLENLVGSLNKFAAAIADTPADKLNKTVAGLLQMVVKVTSFAVNLVNDFHTDVVRIGGYVNLYVEVGNFMHTITIFMEDTENEVVIEPETVPETVPATIEDTIQ